MKNAHYFLAMMLISACQQQPQSAQNHDPIRANFVSGCLKAAAGNSQVAHIQSACECVYDTSEKAYANPAEWQKVVQQFNDTEICDEKLKKIAEQAIAQCG